VEAESAPGLFRGGVQHQQAGQVFRDIQGLSRKERKRLYQIESEAALFPEYLELAQTSAENIRKTLKSARPDHEVAAHLQGLQRAVLQAPEYTRRQAELELSNYRKQLEAITRANLNLKLSQDIVGMREDLLLDLVRARLAYVHPTGTDDSPQVDIALPGLQPLNRYNGVLALRAGLDAPEITRRPVPTPPRRRPRPPGCAGADRAGAPPAPQGWGGCSLPSDHREHGAVRELLVNHHPRRV
jgi:hypothetical protein